MLVPPLVTAAAITEELPGAQAWAKRHDVTMDLGLFRERIIRVVLAHEDPVEIFYLQGTFESYRALRRFGSGTTRLGPPTRGFT